eukprot:6172025-Pleurochrysis_carterae.AAC.3
MLRRLRGRPRYGPSRLSAVALHRGGHGDGAARLGRLWRPLRPHGAQRGRLSLQYTHQAGCDQTFDSALCSRGHDTEASRPALFYVWGQGELAIEARRHDGGKRAFELHS